MYGGTFPCGKCIPCKIQKAREWALRCCLELPYWDKSCFITLTYDDEHLPPSGTLVKADFQKFMKRLRKLLEPHKIKMYACGEYGSNTNRPHYHAIIFGVGPGILNHSEYNIIETVWTYGRVFVGDCTFHSARYCAEYIFKKYNGEKKIEMYDNLGLESPFQLQSIGIGKRYLLDNLDDLYSRGYVLYRGGKFSLPRYFADYMLRNDEKRYNEMMKRVQIEKFDAFDGSYDEFLYSEAFKNRDKAKFIERKSIFLIGENNV